MDIVKNTETYVRDARSGDQKVFIRMGIVAGVMKIMNDIIHYFFLPYTSKIENEKKREEVKDYKLAIYYFFDYFFTSCVFT